MQKNSKKRKNKNAKPNTREKTRFWKKKKNGKIVLLGYQKVWMTYLWENYPAQKRWRSDDINCIKRGKRAQYLDGAPEISARWSLLEQRFGYLSPGSEGEKRRPLKHTFHIPSINSVQFVTTSHFYVYMKVYHLFLPSAKWRYVLLW